MEQFLIFNVFAMKKENNAIGLNSVWLDVGFKSSPIFPNVSPKPDFTF